MISPRNFCKVSLGNPGLLAVLSGMPAGGDHTSHLRGSKFKEANDEANGDDHNSASKDTSEIPKKTQSGRKVTLPSQLYLGSPSRQIVSSASLLLFSL